MAVSDISLFLIAEIPGFTPNVGRLVSMMNYVRAKTLGAVAGLTVDQLDYLHDARSNSIGALLSHIASAEAGYQAHTLYGRGLTDEEKHEWGAAIELGDRARNEIRGHDLAHYLGRLEQVRAKTLEELRKRNDQWLDERAAMANGGEVNNYFMWFHVFGHEINHRGQISWLKARTARVE